VSCIHPTHDKLSLLNTMWNVSSHVGPTMGNFATGCANGTQTKGCAPYSQRQNEEPSQTSPSLRKGVADQIMHIFLLIQRERLLAKTLHENRRI
jgi:hypothetical protein